MTFKKKKGVRIAAVVKWSTWINALGVALIVVYVALGDYGSWIMMLVAWILIACGAIMTLVHLWIQ